MTNPVFVAIDTPALAVATRLIKDIRPHVGGVKLGLEFFTANGPAGVGAIAEIGLPIFLDLKFHDIPNTVAKAVEQTAALRPQVLTVHAAGGRAMLAAAKAAAHPDTKVVAVTMLTSLDAEDLAATGIAGDGAAQVSRLAALAQASGVDGIVCSGAEVASVREAWRDGFLVVPGVRPAGSAVGDQKRVVTPRTAIDAGASIIVIGRPITEATDPLAAAQAIAASLYEGQIGGTVRRQQAQKALRDPIGLPEEWFATPEQRGHP